MLFRHLQFYKLLRPMNLPEEYLRKLYLFPWMMPQSIKLYHHQMNRKVPASLNRCLWIYKYSIRLHIKQSGLKCKLRKAY